MAATDELAGSPVVARRHAAAPRAGSRARRLAVLATPAAVYLGVRLVGLLILAAITSANGTQIGAKLSSWDGQWLLALARGGYDDVPPGLVDAFGQRTTNTPLAFFPGYPALVSALRFVTGMDVLAAGLVVSALVGVLGAYGLVRIGELIPGGSRTIGLLLVALFSAAPMAVVLSMTYSEGLFCALAAWALVGVLQRRWLLAGAACALAGLVRPTGAALVAAVALAALVAAIQRRDSWRPLAAILLAPAGLFGYLGYVAGRTGSWDGWFALQEQGWQSRFDGGAATAGFTYDVLVTGRSVLEVGTVAVLIAAFVLLGIGIWQRLPWPLLVYGAAVLLMDVGSNGLMNSKARLLLPAFTLLLPIAIGLAKRHTVTMVSVVVGATLASAWFGAYALTGWPYAI